jgi:hypothetical protein
MPAALSRDPIYRGRRFGVETIELCVRWYLTYRLSYRDLSAMIAERGIALSHTTILRWVQRYVPVYESRWARFARPVAESWRMDETQVSVRGVPHWLYRAVDRHGKTVHSLLRAKRGVEVRAGIFPRCCGSAGGLLAKQDQPRWKQRDSPEPTTCRRRRSPLEVGRGAHQSISKQSHRARSSGR